ncbi:MAG: decarboxylating 6-phosphogluconate dehydrogenase [Bifidobacteriaceae bacterium]|jgi:6-phosphogluconate dehydrogenase|nr:decarboxylating 6-phosphogluconate dehydrogenase [Bifidobacteriaceae bacterium]
MTVSTGTTEGADTTQGAAEAKAQGRTRGIVQSRNTVRGQNVRVTVFMGVSGSGKTTAGALMAGRLGWDFAEADDFHPPANVAKMSAGTPLDDQDRWPWLQALRDWIDSELAAGRRAVMTCSALKREYRDLLRAPGVVFVHMAGSPRTVEERLGARTGHFMPASLLASQYADLEQLDPDEDYVVVDLDRGQTPSQEVDFVIEALGLAATAMTIGMAGLGRMGGNMAARLRAAGHTVIGFDASATSGRDVSSLAELVEALPAPRLVWVMLPAGPATDGTVSALAGLLSPGDLVVDGGNSPYADDAGHASVLAESGVGFLDVGVSGGVWGRGEGYALMVGGSAADVQRAMPLFEALKPAGDSGFVHAGGVGAGHCAKMVHNGIEYGMMQALGEGYDLLHAIDLIQDPDAVAASWREGSVIRSWLLDLLVAALGADPGLAGYASRASDSGEARWMVQSALDLGVPLPVTAASLYARQVSQRTDNPALRVVSALRSQFGGHTD